MTGYGASFTPGSAAAGTFVPPTQFTTPSSVSGWGAEQPQRQRGKRACPFDTTPPVQLKTFVPTEPTPEEKYGGQPPLAKPPPSPLPPLHTHARTTHNLVPRAHSVLRDSADRCPARGTVGRDSGAERTTALLMAAGRRREQMEMDAEGQPDVCHICFQKEDTVRCAHCDKECCESCSRMCADCQETFCTFCSTVDYRERYERSFCLDCQRHSTGPGKCPPAVPVATMVWSRR